MTKLNYDQILAERRFKERVALELRRAKSKRIHRTTRRPVYKTVFSHGLIVGFVLGFVFGAFFASLHG